MCIRRLSLIAAIVVLLTLGLPLSFVLVKAGNPNDAYLPLVITPPTPDENFQIEVGDGYTDVSPKQLVRTSTNRLYVVASNCESFPCIQISQSLRVYRASTTGIPAGAMRFGPTAAIVVPRTSTSARSNVPLAVTV